jgi:outer membrane protein OmpA-like peptidoglycan-associated protein
MIEHREREYELSYWPSVSDLFMTMFIIAMALVVVVLFVRLPNPIDKMVVAKLIAQTNEIRSAVDSFPPVPKNAGLEKIADNLELTAAEVRDVISRYRDLVGSSIVGAASKHRKEIANLMARIKGLRQQLETTQIAEELAERRLLKIQALEQRLASLTSNENSLRRRLNMSAEEIDRLEQTLARLADGKRRLEDKPPIITVADGGNFFPSGSAVVGVEFEKDLKTFAFSKIAEEILSRNLYGQGDVNTLEIIGHTDGIRVNGRGNLDEELPSILSGLTREFGKLRPGSNNDLGLLRALAIRNAWQDFAREHEESALLSKIAVRTYSAGQTLPVTQGRFSEEDSRARRIELRLTKLTENGG